MHTSKNNAFLQCSLQLVHSYLSERLGWSAMICMWPSKFVFQVSELMLWSEGIRGLGLWARAWVMRVSLSSSQQFDMGNYKIQVQTWPQKMFPLRSLYFCNTSLLIIFPVYLFMRSSLHSLMKMYIHPINGSVQILVKLQRVSPKQAWMMWSWSECWHHS